MTGFGSPCGACKYLRRKCVKGCVFAPNFSHEQGAAHFPTIHNKVFGASNVSKLLMRLLLDDRCEAAVTITYEAQARIQDPVYGCVSHIFALQQVVNLQAQLTSLRSHAAATQDFDTVSNNTNSFARYQEEGGHNMFQSQTSIPNSPMVYYHENIGFIDSSSCMHSSRDFNAFPNNVSDEYNVSFATDESSSCEMRPATLYNDML